MKKEFIVQLSGDLFQTKIDIEKELVKGNKSNADLYALIIKTIDFPAKLNMGDLISATIVQKLEGDYFFYGNVATYSKKEGQRMKNFMLKEIGKL